MNESKVTETCSFNRPSDTVDEREKSLYSVKITGADTLHCHHLNLDGKHCVLNGIPSESARKCQGILYVSFGWNGGELICNKEKELFPSYHTPCSKEKCPFLYEGKSCPYMQNLTN